MEIKYYGANCFKFVSKNATVVVDDNLKSLGLKSVASESDICIYTQERLKSSDTGKFIINGQGEYEVSGVSVIGFSCRAHTDNEEEKTATVYRITISGITVAVIGHVDSNLSDEQLEALGAVDVLIVPAGGNGYTLDGVSAAKLVKDIEPKIVIPSHYQDSSTKYEVPQNAVDEFFKETGVTSEAVDSLKLKSGDLPIDSQEFYLLNRS